MGVSCGLVLWLSLRKANGLAFELVQEKVLSIAVSTAPRIDGDRVEALVSPDQTGSTDHALVRETLQEVADANAVGALPVRFIYIVRPREEGSWEYVVGGAEKDEDDKPRLGDEVVFRPGAGKPARTVARVGDRFVRDSLGTTLSAFAPIPNAAGEPVAVLGVDIAAERILAMLRKLLFAGLAALLLALVLAAALGTWLSRKVTRPLTELRDFVRKLGQGDLSSRLEVKTSDEFGELTRAANLMAERLEERESLKGTLVHYVRSQAADSKLSDPETGERVRRKITVLVAELCGFDQLSSMLGNERVFALLNEYFSTMIDVVLRYRGSLEKSSDRSVIAVFGSAADDPHQEREAMQAALSMQNVLAQLVHEWNIQTSVPVSLEIGIHTADALASTLGRQDQLDFDSVRRVIETATEVKDLGRKRNNRLTVSEATAENLHHAFPLEAVVDDTLDYAVFRVEMPKPTLR